LIEQALHQGVALPNLLVGQGGRLVLIPTPFSA
jgi:hypothetical protein